jgi:ribose transport system substrate-binding protein
MTMQALRRLAASACLLFLLVAAAGCGSSDSSTSTSSSASASTGASTTASKPCRIGFSYGNTSSSIYVNVVRFSRAEAAKRGCKLVEGAAGGDPAKQFNEIQQWIENKQVDALVVLPIGGKIDPLIKQANAAKIPVVGYASEIPGGQAAILYNNKLTGEELASAAVKWAQDKFGKDMSAFSYGIFTYDQCGTPCTERTDTVKQVLQDKLGVKPVANGEAVAEDTGLKVAENMLQAHPKLSMLLGVNDAGILGAVKAVEQAGRAQDMFLGGMDGQLEALEAIAKGGPFKATSALQIADIGNAVVDLPADILENGSAKNLILQPVLIDSPEAAQKLVDSSTGK